MLQPTPFEDGNRRRLPRRDYFLIPLTSLATVLVLLVSSEIAARHWWPEQTYDPCFVEDSLGGFRFEPNCTSRTRNAEGSWVTNHFNECGYRSNTSCLTKAPGAFRLVILGSSVSQGLFVSYEQTFYARTAAALKQQCGLSVDVQNAGVPEASPLYVYKRLNEAIKLRPDAVLYPITPFDLEQDMDPEGLQERNNPNYRPNKPPPAYQRGWLAEAERQLRGSRTVLVAQHFLFENTDTFLRLYFAYGDKADFLREPLTNRWETRFANMSQIIADMATRLNAAHIPLIIMPVPSRAEAALLGTAKHYVGTDPSAFGQRLCAIAEKDGAQSINAVESFRNVPHPETLFYIVDGHLTSEGQQVLAYALTEKLRLLVHQTTSFTAVPKGH